MSTFRTMSGQSFTLASSISSTQTTITLSSFRVPVSNTAITMTTMGSGIAYGTLAPGTSSAELISFTGVTQNADGTATLTGVTRGLDKQYPGTESTTFKQPHAGQTIFILSDAPQVYNEYPARRNDETITGKFTFPQSGSASAAVAGAVYAVPTQNTEFATKKYVDDTASFGAPFATTGIAGIVELPTQTQNENGTQVGGTGAQLALPDVQYGARKILGYNTTGGSANAYTLSLTPTPTAYATGQIIGFLASFTNTGNATINVNSLGAKNLFLGSTGLFAGAIATNAYIGAVYDGTQFEIIEGADLISTTGANKIVLTKSDGTIDSSLIAGFAKFGGNGSDGALSVSSGNTNIDLGGASFVVKNYTSISITGTGSVTFINPATTGTWICLKSQGNVTLTSSATPMLDASGCGTAGGAAGVNAGNSTSGTDIPQTFAFYSTTTNSGGRLATNTADGAASTAISNPNYYGVALRAITLGNERLPVLLVPGAGGGGGTSNNNPSSPGVSGAGGNGGGALYIECAGAWNFTTANGISVAGKNGTAGSGTTNRAGGGGGGGAGMLLALYNTLTANSGTVNVSAGSGGAPTSGVGTAYGGGGGSSLAAAGAAASSGTGGAGGAAVTNAALILKNNSLS